MADLRIDLAAEFKGKKAFKEADKSVSGLDKTVGKLGKQIASVFAAQKILAFGKASLKAFAEDQASAARLTKTVDNLGLAFANPAITQFIQKLSMQSGIVDETLRPAFQGLLTTTGDVTKSMDFLTKAVDISRGSGIDLATVTQDLANGYVGITKGLKKYNLGLSQAQLKSKSFEEIMGLLNKQFNGASAAYLETYSGKMAILNTAADNAKETIGKGLVDALTNLGGQDTNVQDVATAMQGLADNTANAIVGVSVLLSKLKQLPGNGFGIPAMFSEIGSAVARPYMDLANLGKKSKAVGYGDYAGSTADYQRQQNDKAAAKAKAVADAKAAALAKSTLKNQKALTDQQKKQAALKKAGTIFDLEQIQILAALKGKVSEEDRTRLELQLALAMGNLDEAKKLTYELAIAQGLGMTIAKDLASLPQAANPFASWEAYLDKIAEKARMIANSVQVGIGSSVTTNALSSSESMVSYSPSTGLNYNANASQPVINVTVQGNIIREQELINQVLAGAQLSSLSGSPSQIGRIAGMFG